MLEKRDYERQLVDNASNRRVLPIDYGLSSTRTLERRRDRTRRGANGDRVVSVGKRFDTSDTNDERFDMR